MPVEIEAKLKVDDLNIYAERIAQLGGRVGSQFVQRDYFFDYSDRRLLSANCGLRLRQQSQAGRREIMLCYKGPPDPDSSYKCRREIEFTVGDLAAAQALLEALGLEVTIAFEKRRRLGQVAECTICLDEVVELGCFIEIEGPTEAAVAGVQKMLQLESVSHCPASYAVMLAQHLQKTNHPSAGELFF